MNEGVLDEDSDDFIFYTLIAFVAGHQRKYSFEVSRGLKKTFKELVPSHILY